MNETSPTIAWSKLLGGGKHDFAQSLTTGADGAIYMAGYTSSSFDGQTISGESDAYITRYNSDGSKAWTKLLGGGGRDFAMSLTTGADGAIYVAGYTSSSFDGQTVSGGGDAYITRYNSDGSKAWTKLLGGSSSDHAYSLTTGADGAIYVAGYTTSYSFDGQTISGESDAYITRYNSDGSKAWTKLFGGGSYDYASSLTTGGDGAIYVAGYTTSYTFDGQTISGESDAYITRYNSDGSKAWTKLLGGGGSDYAMSLTTGADGAIYVAGTTSGSSFDGQTNSGGHEAFITRYNSDGSKAWTKLLGGSSYDYASSLTTGGDGAIYVAGSTTSPSFDGQTNSGSTDAFIIKLTETPSLSLSGKTFSLAENSLVGKTVGTLSATNSTSKALTYSITAGNTDIDKDGKAAFAINSSTGAITVNDAGDLNYEGTKTFALTVKASDGSLSSTATATVNLTNVNEAPTGSVSISGSAIQGQVLKVVSTLSDPDGAGTAKVQWLRDGSSISGANSSSYTLGSSDVGKAISARLSYTDGGGFAETRTSAAVVPSGMNPGVSITGSDKVTGEDGNTAVFSVKLDKAPVDPVTVRFAVSDTTEANLSTSSLTFTSTNWNTAQSLTVTGLDDYDNDGNVAYNLTATVSTNDLSYKRVTVSSIALVNNNDALDAPILNNGTSGIDYIKGNNGNDRPYGDDNMDEIRGGRGDDRIYGENDDDVLYGDDGNDWVYGGYDDDNLYGGAGNDELYGEAGTDRLEGGAGNDYLDGGTGADTMIGGAGNDTYFVDNAKDVIDDQGATTDEDTVIVMATISYKLAANVENAELNDASGDASLTGNTLSNDLTGNDSKNTLDGGVGNDVLDAGAGNDTLLGGDGTDILIGGLGTDILNGGTGDDLVDFTDAAAGFVNVNLATGKASGDGSDTLISIEDVIGSDGDDIIVGSAVGNELAGGLGTDSLYGGADKVIDVFDFNAITESKTGTSRDNVFDFITKIDKIDLSGIDANTAKAKTGDQAFLFNNTTAKANSVWYAAKDVDGSTATKDLIVYGDVNGDAKADFEIGLVGVTSIGATDFVL